MRFPVLLAAAVFCSTGVAAHAESFNFNFGTSSSAFSGAGILTTGTQEAAGEYSIISVTGFAETAPNGAHIAITSILAPGSFPTPINGGSFPANDNTLFVNNGIAFLSQDGLSFILNDGAQINLYNDGPGLDALLRRNTGGDVSEDATVTISAVAQTPEMSSLILLGTGLLAAAPTLKRYQR